MTVAIIRQLGVEPPVLFASRSPPFPQLLPHLDERLHLLRAGKSVVDHAAVLVRLLVEVPDSWQAEVREVVSKLLQVLFAQNLHLTWVWTPSHCGANSTLFRLVFAIAVMG